MPKRKHVRFDVKRQSARPLPGDDLLRLCLRLVRIIMPLDTFGKIAAGQLGFYVPIAGLTLYLTVRYALRRDAGWLFLALFSLGVYILNLSLCV